jgi:nicotinate phosphoribosyltransferase
MMIIKSLLDTDYYKFSMGQLVFHQYPNDLAEYKFTCRTKGIDLTPYKEEIESEIKHLESLSFSEDELSFLGSARYMKSDYINFLRTLKLKFEYVNVYIKDGILNIRVRGPWKETIYFEVLVLSIVNEVYFRNTQNFLDKEQVGLEKLHAKIDLIKSYNEECKAKGLPLFSLSDC